MLRVLSGAEIVKIFKGLGFAVASQRGSHIKLRRVTVSGLKQTISFPLHDEMDKGTIRAIYRQALKYITEEELRPYFYS